MNDMSAVVDLREENDGNNNDHGPPAAQLLAEQHLEQQRQQHHVRLRIDMCHVSKPSVRFGPGRGRGSGQWAIPLIYPRYVDSDVMDKMEELRNACILGAQTQGVTIIPRSKPCIVKAWFFQRRPLFDFVGRQRNNPLTEEAKRVPNTIVAIKPNVDNYGKFLLDSLTGALFEDDAQVVALHMYKCRDNEGECYGRMQIECSLLNDAARALIFPNW